LITGDLISASEEWMAELERETGEGDRLYAALETFVSNSVVYGGGWGAQPDLPVIVNGAGTQTVYINAVHRYLELLLGRYGTDWQLDGAYLLGVGDHLFDLMHVNLCGGEQISVFFATNCQISSTQRLPTDKMIGCYLPGGSARTTEPMFSVKGYIQVANMHFVQELDSGREFVLEHLLSHSLMTELLSRNGVFGQALVEAQK
jgi:hypothetical protein